MKSRNLAPEWADLRLLKGSKMIIPGSAYEAEVLEQYLGVMPVSEADFIRDVVLPG